MNPMKIKKLIASIMCFVTLTTLGSMSVHAATVSDTSIADGVTTSIEQIEPRADIIENKYRLTPDGRIQYRRWNSTKGYWVDPEWIYL